MRMAHVTNHVPQLVMHPFVSDLVLTECLKCCFPLTIFRERLDWRLELVWVMLLYNPFREAELQARAVKSNFDMTVSAKTLYLIVLNTLLADSLS